MGMLGGGVQDNVCLSFTSMSANGILLCNPWHIQIQTFFSGYKHGMERPANIHGDRIQPRKRWWCVSAHQCRDTACYSPRIMNQYAFTRWLTIIAYSLNIFFSLFRRLFGPDVSEAFLKNNDMRLVVRSHQCVQNGYQFTHSGNVRVTCVGEKLCFC